MEHPKAEDEVEVPPSPSTDMDEPDGIDLASTKTLESSVSLPRECLVVLLISMAQFTTQNVLGQTISLLHIIGDSFDITKPGVLSWFAAGYSLTVGTFILFSGRLGDVFGWKNMLVLGYLWFAIWSAVSGFAVYSGHVLFIFSRVLAGIGPAICLPNGLALLGALYQPGKRKNMAFAIFGGCAPTGAVTGYVVGGSFNLVWWPWSFWFSGISLLVIAAVAYFAIPDPQDDKPGIQGTSLSAFFTELDILGAASGITALILFNFAWNQAPVVGWQSPYVIVTLILGVLIVPLFFYIEIKIARNPLLPFDVFTSDNAFVLACMTCGWGNFGIWYLYTWQTLYNIRGISPILGAAYLSPLAVSGLLAAVATGFILAKTKSAWTMLIAMCAFTIGSILTVTLPPHQIYWAQIFVMMLVTPWGMDMSFPAATLVISDSVDKAHQGTAASLVNTIVNYSISLGLGFAGTVEAYTQHTGRTEDEVLLDGYHNAEYMGIGLAGTGVFLSIVFVVKSYWDDRRKRQKHERKKSEPVKG